MRDVSISLGASSGINFHARQRKGCHPEDEAIAKAF